VKGLIYEENISMLGFFASLRMKNILYY